ncbi:MAG: hypothetical protein FJ152_05020 [Firmicutes bacterium]|nr:hypothetical protein [Bacillota bacterium]
MADHNFLTVEKLLSLPQFKHAAVLTGKNGLNNQVVWSHVMEVTNCRDYINGNDFILTTGAGWKDIESAHFYIKQLIEAKAAALCIQLGTKFNFFDCTDDIPKEIIKEAEQNNLPLIVFPKDHECRYIDLIRDIHALIINSDYKVHLEQEVIINEINEISIRPHDLEDLFHHVHQKLNVNIAYIPIKGRAIFIPYIEKHEKDALQNKAGELFSDPLSARCLVNSTSAYYRIMAYNHDLAYLIVISPTGELSKSSLLILEKFSMILTQDLMANYLINEKERQVKENWVARWFSGRLKHFEIIQHLQESEPHLQPTGCVIFLVSHSSEYMNQIQKSDTLYKVVAIIRSFLEEQGFYLYWIISHQQLLLALVDIRDGKTWKTRIKRALHNIEIMLSADSFDDQTRSLSFAIGKRYAEIDHIDQSLTDAKEALYMGNIVSIGRTIFYDEMHVYRILVLLEKHSSIEEYVAEYLGPILKYKKQDSSLIDTLIALRDCQYNKKEAAEHLSLARQSLYQRIETIKHLLGDDLFDSADKRICIEIALFGLEYINNKKKQRVVDDIEH